MNEKNNLMEAIPSSVLDAVTALLMPYGVNFCEMLAASIEKKASLPHSTRGYCNAKTAAKYLNVSVQTLWRMCQRGIISGHSAGNGSKKRYSYDELDAAMAKNNSTQETY